MEGLQTGYNMARSLSMAAPFLNASLSARVHRMPSHTGDESGGSSHSRMGMGEDERNPFGRPFNPFH
eukprot:3681178-Pleurochrysis_carterae.AAC.1